MPILKSTLHALAMNVNILLDEYIAIENEAMKPSWRRMIPLPFIFQPIDFGALHGKTKPLLSALNEIQSVVEKLVTEAASKSTERDFGFQLGEYCTALIRTVVCLQKILSKLFLKSQGESYSLEEYGLHTKHYKEARENYLLEGQKLNQLYETLFS